MDILGPDCPYDSTLRRLRDSSHTSEDVAMGASKLGIPFEGIGYIGVI